MKYLLIILSLILQNYTAKCDFVCIDYLVEIELNNKNIVQGHYLYGGWPEIANYSDSLVFEKIKENSIGSSSFDIYKKIDLLNYPEISQPMNSGCIFKLNAVSPENTTTINFSEVKTFRVLNRSACVNCFKNNTNNTFDWNGISPSILTDITKEEIALLQNKPEKAYKVSFENIDYFILAYDSKYLNEIDKLKTDLDKIGEQEIYIKYSKFKDLFRNKNAVFIRLQYD